MTHTYQDIEALRTVVGNADRAARHYTDALAAGAEDVDERKKAADDAIRIARQVCDKMEIGLGYGLAQARTYLALCDLADLHGEHLVIGAAELMRKHRA